MRADLLILALVLVALAACSGPYEGSKNLRDCSQWSTTSTPGCFDPGR